jgi:hypothetical protein
MRSIPTREAYALFLRQAYSNPSPQKSNVEALGFMECAPSEQPFVHSKANASSRRSSPHNNVVYAKGAELRGEHHSNAPVAPGVQQISMRLDLLALI